ncbi:MAG: tRNA uridine-5-carboxymethylaminomethyl(34) synthesis GTPase MnmE [Bacteroidia bacterium]|nr:tRNA uridine-5-carboxymethylaminomethyl(34) synthesis GTPase MnmE [Bacteroidia bacterium]
MKNEDTITAIATPAGSGAIALLRLSGNKAFAITEALFKKSNGNKLSIEQTESHTIHHGYIYEDEQAIDEVLVYLFKNPHSYTGEDIVEISCHGSTFVQQKLLNIFIKRGARLAEPGEFTLRAFLNGKLDLSQAEAVADVIASNSEKSHEIAIQQMRGAFSNELKSLREQLIHFASMIELELDFSEEDVEFANRKQLMLLLNQIEQKLNLLSESFHSGNALKNGILTVIAGKPNAGKSTLLNTLVQDNRAIVSDIAGTTRDTIEEEWVLDGIRFRFIDTAGIREATDVIESMGVERTLEKISSAPIILYLFDPSELSVKDLKLELDKIKENHKKSHPYIITIINKIDKYTEKEPLSEYSEIENLISISALKQTNIDELKNKLKAYTEKLNLEQSDTVVSNVRHYEALQNALDGINETKRGLDNNLSSDLLATNIRDALHYLGEITGEVTTDDLLDNIFSKFCIGK